jgi:NAD(P)-dependent dehydrogenase (short-subunit alcohol dehydrogenase family)
MRARRSGTIVMMSSRSGRLAFPGLGAYAATKFALEGLTEAWRHELRPFGIRVHSLQPGPYKTDIWERNARISRRTLAEDSDYTPLARRLQLVIRDKTVPNARDPMEVARRAIDLVERPSARFRHPMGGFDQGLLSRLPFWVQERVIGKLIGG